MVMNQNQLSYLRYIDFIFHFHVTFAFFIPIFASLLNFLFSIKLRHLIHLINLILIAYFLISL